MWPNITKLTVLTIIQETDLTTTSDHTYVTKLGNDIAR